jgi:hypothetical protein
LGERDDQGKGIKMKVLVIGAGEMGSASDCDGARRRVLALAYELGSQAKLAYCVARDCAARAHLPGGTGPGLFYCANRSGPNTS